MNREVFEIVRGMDLKDIETQLALQCAPLITGLKISNLLILPTEDVDKVIQMLENTEIFCYVLFTGEEKATLMLFRVWPLEKYLAEPSVREILKQSGYCSFDLKDLLAVFAARYTAHRNGKADFPHEMGLFLGYPVEDVTGFVENGGKNYLCSGYWKVYRDAAKKKQLFRRFEQAKEVLIQLISHGISMVDVIDVCK